MTTIEMLTVLKMQAKHLREHVHDDFEADALEEAAARLERGEEVCRCEAPNDSYPTTLNGIPLCQTCGKALPAPEPPARDALDDPGRHEGHICGGELRQYPQSQCGLCGDGPLNNPAPSAPPEEPVEVAAIRLSLNAGMVPWDAVDVQTVLAYADRLRKSLRLAREERDKTLECERLAFAAHKASVVEASKAQAERELWKRRFEAADESWRGKMEEAAALRARCGRLAEALGDAIEAIEVCSTALEPHWGSNARRDARHAADAARAALAEEAT